MKTIFNILTRCVSLIALFIAGQQISFATTSQEEAYLLTRMAAGYKAHAASWLASLYLQNERIAEGYKKMEQGDFSQKPLSASEREREIWLIETESIIASLKAAINVPYTSLPPRSKEYIKRQNSLQKTFIGKLESLTESLQNGNASLSRCKAESTKLAKEFEAKCASLDYQYSSEAKTLSMKAATELADQFYLKHIREIDSSVERFYKENPSIEADEGMRAIIKSLMIAKCAGKYVDSISKKTSSR